MHARGRLVPLKSLLPLEYAMTQDNRDAWVYLRANLVNAVFDCWAHGTFCKLSTLWAVGFDTFDGLG